MAQHRLQAYVLGLEGERFRGEPLLAFLRELSLPCEHVVAIDARRMPPDYWREKCDQAAAKLAYGMELLPAEIACALGHEEMYRRFLATDEEWALMLEDDAMLRCDPRPLLQESGRMSAASVIQLNRNTSSLVLCERGLPPIPGVGRVSLRRNLDPGHGTHAYLINRAAARIAVWHAERFPVIHPADWPFLWRGRVHFWDVIPEISPREAGVSCIDSVVPRNTTPLEDTWRLKRAVYDLTGYSSLRLACRGYPLATSWNERVGRSFIRNLVRLRSRCFSPRPGCERA